MDIKPAEWKERLSQQIPSIIPASKVADDPNLRDRVTGWYEACLDSLEEQEDLRAGILGSVPLLCKKGQSWAYISNNDSRWLADDNTISGAFDEKIWQVALGRLGVAAQKYFGLSSLANTVTQELHQGQERLDDRGLQTVLQDTLPYIYAWRRSRSKQDPERLRDNLLVLRVTLVDELSETLALIGIGSKRVVRKWSVVGNELLICAAQGASESHLGHALAHFLRVSRDADFYENLLFRCRDDDERRDKLLSEDVPSDEIDRLLREYRDELGELPSVGEDESQDGETQRAEPGGSSASAGPTGQSLDSSGDLATEASSSMHSSSSNPPVGGSAPSSQPTQLKDPDNAEIEFVTTAPISSSHSGHRDSGSGVGGDSSRLSQEQKWEIERCGRACAKRQLREDGWQVTVMPPEHPGFDLSASKGGKQLRVEVKGHRRMSNVAQLTVRQYEEYGRCLGSGDAVTWQLWSVENLADDAGHVRITRFKTIPEDALRSREFSVDLVKCEAVQ